MGMADISAAMCLCMVWDGVWTCPILSPVQRRGDVPFLVLGWIVGLALFTSRYIPYIFYGLSLDGISNNSQSPRLLIID